MYIQNHLFMKSSFDNLVHPNRKDFQACKYKAYWDITVSNEVSYLIFQNNFEEILVDNLYFWLLHPHSSFTYHGDEPPAWGWCKTKKYSIKFFNVLSSEVQLSASYLSSASSTELQLCFFQGWKHIHKQWFPLVFLYVIRSSTDCYVS